MAVACAPTNPPSQSAAVPPSASRQQDEAGSKAQSTPTDGGSLPHDAGADESDAQDDASARSQYAEFLAWLRHHEIHDVPDGNCVVVTEVLLACEQLKGAGDARNAPRSLYRLVLLAPVRQGLVERFAAPIGAGPMYVLEKSERARYFVKLEYSFHADGTLELREHSELSCAYGRSLTSALAEHSVAAMRATARQDLGLVQQVCAALGNYALQGNTFVRQPARSKSTSP
jgi:hypothetical protein